MLCTTLSPRTVRTNDVTKHRTVRTGAKYRSWVLVKCVWCSAYYWFRLRKGTGYGFHAFLNCMLLLLLLIQCKISLYLGPVQTVRCFVTPPPHVRSEFCTGKSIDWCVYVPPKVQGEAGVTEPRLLHEIGHNTISFGQTLFSQSTSAY